MSLKTDRARLEYVISMIDDIETITRRHGDIDKTLLDREGFHAIMMCLLQIGETLSKLENEQIIVQLPIALSKGLRNIIAHDYIGISVKRIADTVTHSIPNLKIIVSNILLEEKFSN